MKKLKNSTENWNLWDMREDELIDLQNCREDVSSIHCQGHRHLPHKVTRPQHPASSPADCLNAAQRHPPPVETQCPGSSDGGDGDGPAAEAPPQVGQPPPRLQGGEDQGHVRVHGRVPQLWHRYFQKSATNLV